MSYEQNGRKYVTHYKIIEWHSREDWETLLNQMDAEGDWRQYRFRWTWSLQQRIRQYLHRRSK